MRGIHIAQCIAFGGAQIANSVLIFLIITRTDKQFGNFRYIMGVYAFYAIFYSWVEICTQPLSFIEGPALGVIVDSPLRYYKRAGHYVVYLFCACFGLCISLLGTQFYYRYLALCKSKKLDMFSGPRLPLIFIPSLLVFIIWYLNVLIGMEDTIEKEKFLKNAFETDFSLDSYQLAFVVCMFWKYDENGIREWNLVDCIAALFNVFIITFGFTFISICSFKMYENSKKFKMFVSAKTRDLNRQLFLCLVLQTLIPFLLMYCPVGLLYVFPLFGLEVRWLVSIPGLSCCLYPSIEPFIAIFCIKGFRNSVFCKNSEIIGYSSNTVEVTNQKPAPKTNIKVFVLVS